MSEAKAERLLVEAVGLGAAPAELPRAGVLVIGNDKKRAGFVVDGPGVADAHCAVGRTKGGGWALKDLGSPAGTLLNGKRVESARLSAGDELTLGTVTLRVFDPARALESASKTSHAPENRALDAAELSNELARTESARSKPSEERESPRSVPLPQIPGYRVDRRIGRGGMGDVYLAVQESLERQVAIKVLSTKFEADREFVRRFQAEARAAAALNHPNVVTVYDVGESRGTHYLSMEFMDKGNLEDRVGKGSALSEREVLDILRDAATGLVYAEQRGIVHRDLKPANLMQNHVGQTKIADLGLATHVESEEAQTADKKIFGTPHFMSPEQARGERLDHRSDLYSLGATAYRLLTGHTPFEGQNARDIVRSLLRDEPRSMRELVPSLSDGAVGLVSRLMKKDPAQRFASAADVLREIERLRAPMPAAASLATNSPEKPRSRGGGVFVLLLMILGAGGWWWWRQQQDGLPFSTGDAPSDAGSAGAARFNTAEARPPVAEPGDAAASQPAGGKPTVLGPKDKDDKDLQLFEANARLALFDLLGKNMSPDDRRNALRSLAAQYQGTSASTEALEKADAITNELVDANSAAEARKGEREQVLSRLREAAQLDDRPPHPGRSFKAMSLVEGQTDLLEAPEFIVARKGIEAAVAKTAVLYAEEIMSSSKADLDRGDFDSAKKKLEDLMPVFDMPDFPMSEAPSGVGELYEVGRRARERYHNLDSMKVMFATKRDRDDAVIFARGVSAAPGLEREIKKLDLAAARARMDALAQKLSSPAAKSLARDVAQDCARAQAAIETLMRECAAGNWRRKSFTDPRERRLTMRNAVGADSTGIVYEPEGGGTDHVPWSAYGANTKELSKLFLERCNRDWNADEIVGITTLLRLSAVVEALDVASKMFDASRKVNFTDVNQRDLVEGFTQIMPWIPRAPSAAEKVARESEAASLLANVLRRTTDAQWSTAVAGGERLLREFGDTLLVRLMSNGELPPDAPSMIETAPVGPETTPAPALHDPAVPK